MIVFWRGYGFIGLLAALLPIGVNFALSYPVPQSTAVPVGFACLFSAIVCFLAWRVLRKRPEPHTLYGLPLSIWSIVYIGFATWCFVAAARP
ncbi:MAG: hypothetical protein N2112_05300 [Gemmataceae bacterium]|jgi:hypothetical protein|nr:hypothetical protein [Gemmataceae bacterium]